MNHKTQQTQRLPYVYRFWTNLNESSITRNVQDYWWLLIHNNNDTCVSSISSWGCKGCKSSKSPRFFRKSAPGHPRSLMSFKQFRAWGHLWVAITEVKLLRSPWTLQTASCDNIFEAMDQDFMPLMAVLKLITSQWRSWFLPGSGFWSLGECLNMSIRKFGSMPRVPWSRYVTLHVHEDIHSTSGDELERVH